MKWGSVELAICVPDMHGATIVENSQRGGYDELSICMPDAHDGHLRLPRERRCVELVVCVCMARHSKVAREGDASSWSCVSLTRMTGYLKVAFKGVRRVGRMCA